MQAVDLASTLETQLSSTSYKQASLSEIVIEEVQLGDIKLDFRLDFDIVGRKLSERYDLLDKFAALISLLTVDMYQYSIQSNKQDQRAQVIYENVKKSETQDKNNLNNQADGADKITEEKIFEENLNRPEIISFEKEDISKLGVIARKEQRRENENARQ